MTDIAAPATSSRSAQTPTSVLPPLVRALTELDGKAFRIVVRDAGAGIAFRIQSGRFLPLGASQFVDVTFAAAAADFLLLASRRVDPDTLFFDRRLLIEGDTETGLRLKNTLDAIELSRWISGT